MRLKDGDPAPQVDSQAIAVVMYPSGAGARVGRPFRGTLSRGEAEDFGPGIHRIFWDGRRCIILVLPRGRYVRLS